MCPLSPRSFLCLPATDAISPLSLHDALPIFRDVVEQYLPQLGSRLVNVYDQRAEPVHATPGGDGFGTLVGNVDKDRKSTRLNSSHLVISCAGFCLITKTAAMLTE